MATPNLTAREDRHRRALGTIMRALGLKDAHLAPILGISRSAVQGWRSGGVRLRVDQCEQAAAALGVPFELRGVGGRRPELSHDATMPPPA